MTRPTILLTGAAGQLGFELQHALAPHGDLIACDRRKLDLGDRDAIAASVGSLRPQLIVNAAAYTAVDRAESDAKNAQAINALAPAILANEARKIDAVLIHFSTDYVFDGAATTPYSEDAPTRPLNVYGRSKLEGEQAIAAAQCAYAIFRTSWVYGLRGSNFLMTMQRLARERDELRVVADQIGVPNWTRDIALAVAAIVGRGLSALVERAGLYHLSAAGTASWFEFAQAIVGSAGRVRAAPRIVPITTGEYPTPARRPAYGVLATDRFERTFGFVQPHWRDALARCLQSQP